MCAPLRQSLGAGLDCPCSDSRDRGVMPNQDPPRRPRLTEVGDPEQSSSMFDLDETLIRAPLTGAAIHRVIAALAPETRQPTLAQIQAEINAELHRFRPIEARAHRQNIAGCVQRYFLRCLPPVDFSFVNAEHDLGVGRADLVWVDGAQYVLVDEIKSGHPRSLHLAQTQEQCDRYRLAGLAAWSDRFIGIRLLSVTDPEASLFCGPDGARSPLISTEYLESRS